MRLFAWLTRRLLPPPGPADPPPVPRWAVVADAARDRRAAPGTRPFAPGAKLTVVAVYWGMGGDTVTVVGRHRRTGRFVTAAVPTRQLANVRPERVHSPYLVRRIAEHAEFTQYPADSPAAVAHAVRVAARLVPMSAGTQDFKWR